MTTINRTKKTVEASGNSPKKKIKVSEILLDIKNGNAAQEIIQKHQITLQQLKMIIMQCYKKGRLKKADIVKNFLKKPSGENLSASSDTKTNQPGADAGVANAEKNSIDLNKAVKSIAEKFKNEKIIGGLFPLTAQNICALGLIVFFFFPWINIAGFIKVAGYEIPDATKSLGQLAQVLGETGRMNPKVHLLYLLYLIPICSAVTIFLNAKGRDSRMAGLAAASIPIFMLIFMIFEVGTEILEGIASGVYLTLLGSAGIIIETVYGLDKFKKKVISAAAARGIKVGKSSDEKNVK